MRRITLLLAIVATGVTTAMATPADSLASQDFIRPRWLREGDTVALVSPAGKLPKKIDTARIRERIEGWGLHVGSVSKSVSG